MISFVKLFESADGKINQTGTFCERNDPPTGRNRNVFQRNHLPPSRRDEISLPIVSRHLRTPIFESKLRLPLARRKRKTFSDFVN